MTDPAYDFRQPRQLADDVEHVLSSWQSAFASRIGDEWEKQLGICASWSFGNLESSRLAAIQDSISKSFLCASIRFQDVPGVTWVAVPRQMLLGAVAVLLGDEVAELPEDRELTDVEAAVAQLAWQEVARALTDSQPCAQPLVCEIETEAGGQEVVRRFSEQEPLVVARFELQAGFGTLPALCLFSQDAVLELMTNISECRQLDSTDAEDIETTLKMVPLQVVVRLGDTELPLSELMNLEPGDVLMLDQRVGDPLLAEVNDSAKFRGWPGRLGNRQAFQVSEIVLEGPE